MKISLFRDSEDIKIIHLKEKQNYFNGGRIRLEILCHWTFKCSKYCASAKLTLMFLGFPGHWLMLADQ